MKCACSLCLLLWDPTRNIHKKWNDTNIGKTQFTFNFFQKFLSDLSNKKIIPDMRHNEND